MKYRMVKVETADKVWFETEWKRFFFWHSCFMVKDYDGYPYPAQYSTWENAAESIERHRRLWNVPKRTVVRHY